MTFDPDRHHRRSIRLNGYDYSRAGAYFVTIVAQDRMCFFGDVQEGIMSPNDAGRMVINVWNEIPIFYPDFAVDAFVLMPNHIHGIVSLVGAAPRGRPGDPDDHRRDAGDRQRQQGQAQGPAPTGLSVGDIVQRFKTLTMTRYIAGVKDAGWLPFRGRLWQRNYYEQIVRNESSLSRMRQYIEENPLGWALDIENPTKQPPQPVT